MFHNPPPSGACQPARASRSWTGDLTRFDFGRAAELEQTALPAYLLAAPLMASDRSQVRCTADMMVARMLGRPAPRGR